VTSVVNSVLLLVASSADIQIGKGTKTDGGTGKNVAKSLGRRGGRSTTIAMDQTLIALGVFLAGAASGAALSYLKDRRLLYMYGDLVRQLSSALQEQVDHMPAEAEAQTRWLREQPETVRENSAS
jgi:hypothetical protein